MAGEFKMEDYKNLLDLQGLHSFLQKENVLALYIFGSRARGTADISSDIDLAVLFYPEERDKVNDPEYCINFINAFQQYINHTQLDLIFLQKTGLKMTFKIITTGILLYEAEEEKRLDYEDMVICQGLDFKGELKLYYQEVEKMLEES